MDVNEQYNVAKPGSLPVRVAGHQRRKMYQAFLSRTGIGADDTVLDVGATGDRSYDHSNYLEAWYPHKAAITAVGIDDAGFLEQVYPGVRFVRADGRALPFADKSFDFVHSSAVLEHVGSSARQRDFLREAHRVARKGVFVTTPNRWFPVEFHTVLPLLHWLPAPAFRRCLRAMGRDFFASEDNLNLLTAADLDTLARQEGLRDYRIGAVSLFGWPTNLLFMSRLGAAA